MANPVTNCPICSVPSVRGLRSTKFRIIGRKGIENPTNKFIEKWMFKCSNCEVSMMFPGSWSEAAVVAKLNRDDFKQFQEILPFTG